MSDVVAGGLWYGMDVFHEDIDNFEATVWEPSLVKIDALTAAAVAAALLLRVDETAKNLTSNIVCLCVVWMADAGRPGHRHRGKWSSGPAEDALWRLDSASGL